MEYCEAYESPIGSICVFADDENITGIDLNFCNVNKPNELTASAISQLKEYFDGRRKNFDLPLSDVGTDFQKRVRKSLISIPYGEVNSYKDVAIMSGSPDAQRAVGNAVHINPYLIVVPCHRVIASDGSIGGYAPGIDIKKYLLKLEAENK